eukprot:3503615-Rhodomonas_salina.1
MSSETGEYCWKQAHLILARLAVDHRPTRPATQTVSLHSTPKPASNTRSVMHGWYRRSGGTLSPSPRCIRNMPSSCHMRRECQAWRHSGGGREDSAPAVAYRPPAPAVPPRCARALAWSIHAHGVGSRDRNGAVEQRWRNESEVTKERASEQGSSGCQRREGSLCLGLAVLAGDSVFRVAEIVELRLHPLCLFTEKAALLFE